MFQAMQSGAGSMSTTHAPDARAAIERLVTCAMEANAPAEFAYRQVADHINLIVQIAIIAAEPRWFPACKICPRRLTVWTAISRRSTRRRC